MLSAIEGEEEGEEEDPYCASESVSMYSFSVSVGAATKKH